MPNDNHSGRTHIHTLPLRDLHRLVQMIEREWRDMRVLVVGDVMLDRYVWGEVNRISPEAPVPIVRGMRISEQPGGAANVAMNLVALGATPVVFGFRGDDSDGAALETCLRSARIEPRIRAVPERPTITKTRIFGGKQQMLRLDMETTGEYPSDNCAPLIDSIKSELPAMQAVVLSDYAKGVLSEELCQAVIKAARSAGIPVIVDPKQRCFHRYRGSTTICPNVHELSATAGVPSQDLDRLLIAARKLVPDFELEYLTPTLSERGIAVLTADSVYIAPAVAREVFDVSGAGDTVVATLALAMASGLDMETAVQLANAAAGIVVGKVGTVPVTRDELLLSLSSEMALHAEEKIISLEEAKMRVSAWRAAGQRIVFTNGCFDILHLGHITLLEEARREGDRLIVAINSDDSVRMLKGPSRPIVGERSRARILAALAAVDAVLIFDQRTPLSAITALEPDVIVKGGDYSEDTVVGAREAATWGGRVKIIPTVEGFSTTRLIQEAAHD